MILDRWVRGDGRGAIAPGDRGHGRAMVAAAARGAAGRRPVAVGPPLAVELSAIPIAVSAFGGRGGIDPAHHKERDDHAECQHDCRRYRRYRSWFHACASSMWIARNDVLEGAHPPITRTSIDGSRAIPSVEYFHTRVYGRKSPIVGGLPALYVTLRPVAGRVPRCRLPGGERLAPPPVRTPRGSPWMRCAPPARRATPRRRGPRWLRRSRR